MVVSVGDALVDWYAFELQMKSKVVDWIQPNGVPGLISLVPQKDHGRHGVELWRQAQLGVENVSENQAS